MPMTHGFAAVPFLPVSVGICALVTAGPAGVSSCWGFEHPATTMVRASASATTSTAIRLIGDTSMVPARVRAVGP